MRLILILITIWFTSFLSHAQTQNEKLNSFVKEWLGVKYRYGGKTKNGIDCSQFNKRLYLDVYGINLENTCSKQWNQSKRIKIADLLEGDLLFFRSTISPSGWHCGVYLGNNRFVHAANKKQGVIISQLSEYRYRKSLKGIGRVI